MMGELRWRIDEVDPELIDLLLDVGSDEWWEVVKAWMILRSSQQGST